MDNSQRVARLGSCALLICGLATTSHAIADPIADGQKMFQRSCAACHGANAKGGRAPDLTTGEWKWGASDDDIVKNILSGIPGTQMPAFPMPVADARTIAGYLKSLNGGAVAEMSSGDPDAGRDLFFGSAQCSRCHMYSGRGGRLGPDLSSIGNQQKLVEIRKAIMNPNDRLRRSFETVEIQLASGAMLRGVKKNEDTFSIQVMDERERLHLLWKRDLKQVTETHKSLMPAFDGARKDLDNLVAFLKRAVPLNPAPVAWKPAADFDVSFTRLKNAAAEPRNWLTYWGDYQGTHYTPLAAITAANAGTLKSEWTFQFAGTTVETSPIVVDGLMFVTGPLNDAAALDARTGRPIWRYKRPLPEVARHCTVMTNRGFGILGDRLYMATLDTHLVSLDAKTGNVIWDVAVDDYRKGFSITHAPLAIDGKIIVGVTSGECGLNGFVDAYDAATGKKLWRFRTIPQKGDPARATWSGDSAETGGGPTWTTGTYDADTETVFWTTGNPAPDYDGSVRVGDNLYTCSVLALDPNTGKLKWHFQFTPHDTHDWDANETPMLIDGMVRGKMRKLLIQANRNAFFYVLDRQTGEFLHGKAFSRQTWARGLDDKGRPMVIPNTDPTPEGNYACPDANGATNWAAPSYHPKTKLFYVAVREACAIYTSVTKEPHPGQGYTGTGQQEDAIVGAPGAIRALHPATGDMQWNFPLQSGSPSAGVLSTGGGVVFASSRDGYLIALDAVNGKLLWRYQTGAEIRSSPISYAVDGKQYVALASDSALFTFALP